MADDDMFMETQVQESEDDIFVTIATEIAVTKIKLKQKKDKVRIAVQNYKQFPDKCKRAEEEKRKLVKNKEERSLQKSFKLTHLNKLQESSEQNETTINDVTRNLNCEVAETKRKKQDFNSKIRNALDTWECYEEQYKQFAHAKQKNELENKKRVVHIELQGTICTINDAMSRVKIMKDITQKRKHVWCINLANLYNELQVNKSKSGYLLNKQRELTKNIEDVKSGKVETFKNPKNPGLLTSGLKPPISEKIKPAVKILEFKMPEFQINSPPTTSNPDNPSKKRSSFISWESILGASSIFSISRNNLKPREVTSSVPKLAKSNDVFAETEKSQIGATKKPVSNQPPFLHTVKPVVQSPSKSVPNSQDLSISTKRKLTSMENNSSVEEDAKQSCQPVKKINIESASVNQTCKATNIITDTLQNDQNSPLEITKGQGNIVTDDAIDNNQNKGNSLKPSSTMEEMIDSIKRTISQKHITFGKGSRDLASFMLQKQIPSKQHKFVHIPDSINAMRYAPLCNDFQNDNVYKPNLQDKTKEVINNIPSGETESGCNASGYMTPNSPPDLLPVENNSQPVCQTSLSQSSEFNSPFELNDADKALYEKLRAEASGCKYKSFDTDTEQLKKNDDNVRSHYFSKKGANSPSPIEEELNTPDVANTNPEEQQNQPLSSPTYNPPSPCNWGMPNLPFSPPMDFKVQSPPTAMLGNSNTEKVNAGDMPLFNTGRNTSENKTEGFNFNFSQPTKNSNIFSLF